MATNATINSHIFKNNLDKKVIEIATPKLVPLIEDNNLDNVLEVLDEYLSKYLNQIDVLVLGCTHYPIIKDYIKEVIGNIDIIDQSNLILVSNNGNKNMEIYFSKINDKIIYNTRRILEKNDIKALTSK